MAQMVLDCVAPKINYLYPEPSALNLNPKPSLNQGTSAPQLSKSLYKGRCKAHMSSSLNSLEGVM